MLTFKQYLQESIHTRQDVEEGWIKDTYELVKKHKKKLAVAGLAAAITAGTIPSETLHKYPDVQKIHTKLRGLASVAGDVTENLPDPTDSSHAVPVSSSNRRETPEEVADRRRKKLVKRSTNDPLFYNREI